MSAPERIKVAPCHPYKEPDDLYVCHPRLQHPAAVEYIRADLVPQWQPIDTAPRDGRFLLLRYSLESGGIEVGHWTKPPDGRDAGWYTSGLRSLEAWADPVLYLDIEALPTPPDAD